MIKINNKTIRYVAVVVLLILFYKLGILSPFEGIINKIFNPVLYQLHSFSNSINLKFKEQTKKIDFNQTIKDQQSEISRLLTENAELKIVKDENEKMRQYLGFFGRREYKKVLAGVISRGDISDSANRIEFFNIDKGSNDGLYPGLAVVNEEGIIVGKIAKVKERVSEVYLVLNDECRIAATILGDDKTSGIVEGDLGLTMQMNFIPQSKKINKGDVIVSSGLEEAIPRGLVIGKVSELTKESNNLWQGAVLDTSANLDEVVLVAVILP